MTKKNDTDGTSRRDFLKLAGAGAPVATVALAASSSVANAANDPDLSKTLRSEERRVGKECER